MSLYTILETLFIGPLKLIFELIFGYANDTIQHPGYAIIVLSLTMNLLVLPLYKRADAMQEKVRDIENKLSAGVAHIKKTFSGDERMMVLQTYYRQNHYKPTDSLKGSVSLLLEIPFFMAAYQFLSHLKAFEGVSFGPIRDLSAPDGLLIIGTVSINILPFVMTLINIISSAIYLKGSTAKTKLQLFVMAVFFLIFLYNSPSCLVFYWTLNNIFSLGKNIVYKLKTKTPIKPMKQKQTSINTNHKFFIYGCLFLTILTGLLIPSTYIAASPLEYVDINCFYNPLWYIVSSFCLAAGTFLIWLNVFYSLSKPITKAIYEIIIYILSGTALINYMFYGENSSVLLFNLQYESGFSISLEKQMTNIRVLAIIITILYIIARTRPRILATFLLIASLSLGCMSTYNILSINSAMANAEKLLVSAENTTPHFQLSQTGQNVVLIMLDRAMNEYIPYIFNEKPELKQQFDGFTYYSNTISYGGHTNFASPAVFGGYEYTPVEINKRDTESMVSKHNESLKVLPVLFSEENYKVTVCDAPYANYQWIPDLSIYDEYPEINTYITNGRFSDITQREQTIQNIHRNFFLFSIMKISPPLFQSSIYDSGRYNKELTIGETLYSYQVLDGMSQAKGISLSFMDSYNVLQNLSNMTYTTDESENTFLLLYNDTTHSPMLLQEPEYAPTEVIDNTQFDAEHTDRFTVNGKTIDITTTRQMAHYQTNMACLMQLGNWFDYLRQNNLYDNTRIILVSDHGYNLNHFDELIFDDGTGALHDAEYCYPLLMVKDFNSESFTTSDEFMTNADVPTLALQNLINDAKNPFTGKIINNSEKTAHNQYIILSHDWSTTNEFETTFPPSKWAIINDNIWDRNNWQFITNETVLKDYTLP